MVTTKFDDLVQLSLVYVNVDPGTRSIIKCAYDNGGTIEKYFYNEKNMLDYLLKYDYTYLDSYKLNAGWLTDNSLSHIPRIDVVLQNKNGGSITKEVLRHMLDVYNYCNNNNHIYISHHDILLQIDEPPLQGETLHEITID